MPYTTQLTRNGDQRPAPYDDASFTRQSPDDGDVTAKASPPLDDSGQGLALFVLFVIAVMFVTGAVALLALVTTWWVLGLAFGIHVLVTAVVSTAVFTVLGSGKLTRNGAARAPAGATPSPTEPVGAPARSTHASPLAA